MSDRHELADHHWDRIADALRPPTADEFFIGQILQMRLDVPAALPTSELSDEVIDREIHVREARIREDSAQLKELHAELERRSEQ